VTEQSKEAAERSAHVNRGSVHKAHEYFLKEVAPGRFQLKAVADAEREVARLKEEVASLRITLGGRTFGADIPEPIGCPAPGACAQVAEIKRLRSALDKIAHSADYGMIISPDGDRHEAVIQTALDALREDG
jgi:hypothetical protein